MFYFSKFYYLIKSLKFIIYIYLIVNDLDDRYIFLQKNIFQNILPFGSGGSGF